MRRGVSGKEAIGGTSEPSRKRRVVKRVLTGLGVLGASFAGIILWACGGIQRPGTFAGPIGDISGPATEPRSGKTLKMLTWNISFAYGSGSEGNGYEPRPAEVMAERLRGIGAAIRGSGADIVLLQEVDFDSHRSGHVDQAAELARTTGLRYVARAVNWQAGYVPFPYWPIARQFGAICAGTAVLSRYPITVNEVTRFPKPRSNSWIYNLFYLFRSSQRVVVRCGGGEVVVFNNHLESMDKENRQEQARLLVARVNGEAAGGRVLVGGDFNTVPEGASKRSDFADDPRDDYRGDKTMSIMSQLKGMKEVVSAEAYRAKEADYFTFPSTEPSRRLDYLFVSAGTQVKAAEVVQTGELSDHLAVMAEVIIP
jgi:endonuclease/exonuclease/phosphatase family metal-dependent hydrolase